MKKKIKFKDLVFADSNQPDIKLAGVVFDNGINLMVCRVKGDSYTLSYDNKVSVLLDRKGAKAIFTTVQLSKDAESVPIGLFTTSSTTPESNSKSIDQNSTESVVEPSTIFSSRFMPNVKFIVPNHAKYPDNITTILQGYESFFCYGYETNKQGRLSNAHENLELFTNIKKKEVSIYEAIPELVPKRMRWNSEKNELVPNILAPDAVKVDVKMPKELNSLLKNIELSHNENLKAAMQKAGDSLRRKPFSANTTRKDNGFVKYDTDKPMYDLVDPFAYEDLAKLLTFGAKKYSKNNWQKGDVSTYISALERHLGDIKKALASRDMSLLIDNDSSIQHGAALMCNSMFIHWFVNDMIRENK